MNGYLIFILTLADCDTDDSVVIIGQ